MTLALKWYAVTAVVLFVKMIALSAVQGVGRFRSNTFVIPEDARFYGKGEPATEEAAIVRRASGAWRNDLENIPIFLILALVYIMAGCWPTGLQVYFPIFVTARVAHSLFYLVGLQPWRTIAHNVALAVSGALSVHIILAVFGTPTAG